MQMRMRMMHRSKWPVPGFSVALGFVYLAVQRANDDPGGGLVIGLVVITAIIAAVFYELARGGDSSPYAQLGAIGGVAYLVALFVLQRRS